MTRVALATSAELPDLDPDDRPLRSALADRTVDVDVVVWDDADVDWSSYDAVVIRSTWDYTGRRDHFVAWAEEVASAVPLFNDVETIRENTDKRYLRRLAGAGVPIVPTHWSERGDAVDLATLMDDRGWDDVVVKPSVSAGARGTLRVGRDDAPEGQAHIDRLLGAGGVMVQPFRPSIADAGELSVVYVAGRHTHAVRKLPAAGDYRIQARLGGTTVPAEPDDGQIALADRALHTWGRRTLYARVDLLDGPDGAELVELELTEPSLFLTSAPHAAGLLADALLEQIMVSSE